MRVYTMGKCDLSCSVFFFLFVVVVVWFLFTLKGKFHWRTGENNEVKLRTFGISD